MNAQQKLAALALWLDESSANRRSPMGEAITVGRYASLIPCSFAAAPPMMNVSTETLLLFLDRSQAEGMILPLPQTGAPAGQDHVYERIRHLLFRMEDSTLPRCAVVPLVDPADAIALAVDRAGLGAADLTAVPIISLALWPLPAAQRADIARRLPLTLAL